jgi:hypothetical protein
MTGPAAQPQPIDAGHRSTTPHVDLSELRESVEAAQVMVRAGATTTAANFVHLQLRRIDPRQAPVLDLLVDAAELYTTLQPDPAWLSYLARARPPLPPTPAPAGMPAGQVVGDWPWQLALHQAAPPHDTQPSAQPSTESLRVVVDAGHLRRTCVVSCVSGVAATASRAARCTLRRRRPTGPSEAGRWWR